MRLHYAYLNEHLVTDLDSSAPALLEQQRPPSLPTTTARRQRLAELDALTDQIQPLLDRLDTTWHAVETDPAWHRKDARR